MREHLIYELYGKKYLVEIETIGKYTQTILGQSIITGIIKVYEVSENKILRLLNKGKVLIGSNYFSLNEYVLSENRNKYIETEVINIIQDKFNDKQEVKKNI